MEWLYLFFDSAGAGWQKSRFQGLSLQEAKWGVSSLFMPETSTTRSSRSVRTGVEITAKTAGASKTIEVEVDKPLGLTLGQKSGGGVVIAGIEGGGNAAKAGLKVGDQVLYTSSFFGDELWPADKLGFTKTALQAKPDSIYFVVSRQALRTFLHAKFIALFGSYPNLTFGIYNISGAVD